MRELDQDDTREMTARLSDETVPAEAKLQLIGEAAWKKWNSAGKRV
jgi:hypothetical protein